MRESHPVFSFLRHSSLTACACLPWLGGLVPVVAPTSAVAQEDASASKTAAMHAKVQAAMASQSFAEAAAISQEIVKINPKDGMGWYVLGLALHSDGKLDEALPAHKEAAKFKQVAANANYNAACVYALKGDTKQTVEWLKNAMAAGFSQADYLRGDSDMAKVLDDPGVIEVLKQMESMGPALQVFGGSTKRGSSRLLWWAGQGSPGQVAVDFGLPAWSDDHGEQIESGKLDDRRWRLGKDFWTRFDTNVHTTFGEQKVPAGNYYLTLERKKGGDVVLAFLDPAEVRKLTLDSFLAQKASKMNAIEVSMKHTKSEDVAGKLDMTLTSDPDDAMKGVLTIRFGPHVLTAPFTAKVGS